MHSQHMPLLQCLGCAAGHRPALPLSVAPVVSQALTKLIAQDKRADCREGELPHRLGNNGGDTVWAPILPAAALHAKDTCQEGGAVLARRFIAWLAGLAQSAGRLRGHPLPDLGMHSERQAPWDDV